MLEITDLSFRYPRQSVWQLEHFSMSAQKGRCTGLIGPSGCAKTTVLRLIAGLERPASGTIRVNGRVLADEHIMVEPEDRGLGMVFQDWALFPHMSVGANIAYGLAGLPASEKRSIVGAAIQLVGLEGEEKKYPHQLSGGQQQRVALARALAPKPSLILLDEPFSNLDVGLRRHLRDEVREILREANITSILVTHDHQDTQALADTVVEMSAPEPTTTSLRS